MIQAQVRSLEGSPHKIGVFPVEEFNKAFDNADIVTRALGDGGVLYESEPD